MWYSREYESDWKSSVRDDRDIVNNIQSRVISTRGSIFLKPESASPVRWSNNYNFSFGLLSKLLLLTELRYNSNVSIDNIIKPLKKQLTWYTHREVFEKLDRTNIYKYRQCFPKWLTHCDISWDDENNLILFFIRLMDRLSTIK